jgi:hypothetical protein
MITTCLTASGAKTIVALC